jgi:hypothetical protein
MLILAESAPSESVINDFACPIGESEMDQFDSATDWSQVVAPMTSWSDATLRRSS